MILSLLETQNSMNFKLFCASYASAATAAVWDTFVNVTAAVLSFRKYCTAFL